MGELPTGTVTFLFTDVEGSTPLWDAHPTGMEAALARHDGIVRSAIEAAGGHVFSTGGDGFAAVFSRAGDAVSAAVAAQVALGAEVWPDGVVLRVRMGLHTGEVQERGGDYFGPSVNRAARLMGAANGGQVVVSALTAGLLHGAHDVSLIDLGAVALKGLVEPVQVFGVEAPGLPWLDLALVSVQRTAGNLPRPQTELVGDLVDLQRRVASLAQARVVTLTGSGGVGKTRAAVEFGWLVVDEFVDGVWLLELASIADPSVVAAAMATTLGVLPQPGMSTLESMVEWCRGRRALLIVDNCEHVIDAVAEAVTTIVTACPTVTVLATSREPLGVAGERVVRIASLSTDLSVELFRARAMAADSSFSGADSDLVAIAAICDRLDGIPLAIELAAARIRSLSPVELLARLDDRFRLLRGSGRGGLERHQTLRAAVSWSYQLLPESHRWLFDRLSVFAGGFDLAAVEAVCADEQIDEFDVVDLLGELVDKSMVIASREGALTRYRLLETLRQYGEERLEDRGETAMMRDRHLAYFSELAAMIGERWLSPRQLEADALADREWDNLRAAHGWAVITSDFTRASGLVDHLRVLASYRLRVEVAEWVQATIDLGMTVGRTSSAVHQAASGWAMIRGETATALEHAEAALSSAQSNDDRAHAQHLRIWCLGRCGRITDAIAAVDDAREQLRHGLSALSRLLLLEAVIGAALPGMSMIDEESSHASLATSIGAPSLIAEALRYRGQHLALFAHPPDLAGSIDTLRTSIELAESADSVVTLVWGRYSMSVVMVWAGDPDATETLANSLAYAADRRLLWAVDLGLDAAARFLGGAGALDDAAVLLGYTERSAAGFPSAEMVRQQTRELVGDGAELRPLFARGAAMDRSAAVAFALARLAERTPTPG